MQPENHETPAVPKRRRRSVFSLIPLLLFTLVWSVVLCAGLLFAVMQDRTIPLPGLFQARLSAMIQNSTDLAEITFDQAEVGLSDTIHPRLILQGVAFTGSDATTGLKLNRMEVIADFWGLLNQEVHPRNLSLAGAVVDMTRNADGSFDYGLKSLPNSARAGSVLEIIDQIEGIARLPQLNGLDEVRIDDLTVNYSDTGNAKAWTFDGGRLVATKTDQTLALRADLALLTGVGDPATLSVSYERMGVLPGILRADIQNVHTGDLASQSPALSWMQLIDARITGSLRSQSDESGLGQMNAHLDFGAGFITPGPGAKPFAVQSAKAYFSYTPDKDRLDLDLLSVQTDKGQASGQGYALLQTDPATEQASGMVLHIQGDAQDLVPLGTLSTPINITQLSATAKVQFAPFALTLGDARFGIEGTQIAAHGKIVLDQGQWGTQMRLDADAATTSKVLKYWPEDQLPKSRKWVSDNIREGLLQKISVGFDRVSGAKPQITSTFEFSQANIRFMKDMPHIKSSKGIGIFENSKFVATIFDGIVTAPQGGSMQIAQSTITIPDTTARPAVAIFDLQGQSTVTPPCHYWTNPRCALCKRRGVVWI